MNYLRHQVASMGQNRVIVAARAPFVPEGYQNSSIHRLQHQEMGAVQSVSENALPHLDSADITKLTAGVSWPWKSTLTNWKSRTPCLRTLYILENCLAWASPATNLGSPGRQRSASPITIELAARL